MCVAAVNGSGACVGRLERHEKRGIEGMKGVAEMRWLGVKAFQAVVAVVGRCSGVADCVRLCKSVNVSNCGA